MGKYDEIRILGRGLKRQYLGVSDEIFIAALKKGKAMGEETETNSHLPDLLGHPEKFLPSALDKRKVISRFPGLIQPCRWLCFQLKIVWHYVSEIQLKNFILEFYF